MSGCPPSGLRTDRVLAGEDSKVLRLGAGRIGAPSVGTPSHHFQLLLRAVMLSGANAPYSKSRKGKQAMAERKYGGITLGGLIVILGIILIVIWSFWIGLIVTLIGLVAFGGFARGKWY